MRQKTFIAAFLLLFCTTLLWASDTSVDGIWYDFDQTSMTASVTYRGSNPLDYYDEYSGSIVIPEKVTYNGRTYNVTSIGKWAFVDCMGLTSVTIPNSVTNIGSVAFDNCRSLSKVIISDIAAWCNIKFSDSSANPLSNARHLFLNDVEIIDLVIPNIVTSIGDYVFINCSSLTSVTIPNSVTSIGNYAFKGCSGLTSIDIPNSVTSIGGWAFSGCSNLTSIIIPNGVTSIGRYTFYGCSNLSSINIPNSVTLIGLCAFGDCSNLTSINIPNSVTAIGEYAFNGCSNLETVSLGGSIETIGSKAFYNCTRIIDIYCYAQRVPEASSDAFDGVSRKAYLWVPANRVRNYKTHELWGQFDVQAIEADGVNTSTVNIVPTDNTAKIIWPAVEDAYTYEITIYDQNGNIVCQLVFDSEGLLQSIAFGAPGRDNAPEATQATGFRFEVNSLTPGTTYNYTIVAKDATESVIDTKEGSFTTTGTTAVEDIVTNSVGLQKVLRNGQLLILHGDKTYTMQGQEVR